VLQCRDRNHNIIALTPFLSSFLLFFFFFFSPLLRRPDSWFQHQKKNQEQKLWQKSPFSFSILFFFSSPSPRERVIFSLFFPLFSSPFPLSPSRALAQFKESQKALIHKLLLFLPPPPPLSPLSPPPPPGPRRVPVLRIEGRMKIKYKEKTIPIAESLRHYTPLSSPPPFPLIPPMAVPYQKTGYRQGIVQLGSSTEVGGTLLVGRRLLFSSLPCFPPFLSPFFSSLSLFFLFFGRGDGGHGPSFYTEHLYGVYGSFQE